MYLEAPRREQFRRAREGVLAARGAQTACLEAPAGLGAAALEAAVPSAGAVTDLCVLADGKTQALRVGVNTIGRLPDNNVVIPDAHASRRHCAIIVHATKQCEVHDMASKNGTFLNGTRIGRPTPLRPGDEIGLGEYRLVFLGNERAPAVQPSSGTQML
jgi:FHA domain-containing protein